jgi:Carboxypeptidase regulatory-like domain
MVLSISRGDAAVRRLCQFALVVLALLFPTGVAAQAVTGTILGTVRDATGGTIAEAAVILTETSTSLARTIATDQNGDYAAPLLATGVYTVRVEAAGFKAESVTGVELGVDQKVRVDVSLTIGDVAEAVVVPAENPLVQRAASDLSATLVDAQIQALPLNGRNFVQLTRNPAEPNLESGLIRGGEDSPSPSDGIK